MSTIGERLKSLRKTLGLSQKEMAKVLGLSLVAYQYYEGGQRKPNLEKLHLLAQKFGVNLHWLLTGEGEPFVGEAVKKKDRNIELDEESKELLELYKNLPPKDRKLILSLLKRVAMATTSGSTTLENSKNF